MTARKRETAAERDERIVAEAGPWNAGVGSGYGSGSTRVGYNGPCVKIEGADAFERTYRAARAAARILNRLARRPR